MIDKIEFSDVKQVRKTLLITSFVGFAFKRLSEHSTGNIEFLGFKIPIGEANVIPNLIGYLVIFLIIALLIRYFDEDLKKKYQSYKEYIETNRENSGNQFDYQKLRREFHSNELQVKSVKIGIILLDLIFPIVFALFTLIKIF